MNDIDSVMEASLFKGAEGLWIRVFMMCIEEIQTAHADSGAKAFIFDPDNFAMDIVADAFDLSAEGLRKMVRESIPGAWPRERKTT